MRLPDEVKKQVLVTPADPDDPFSVPVENPVARAQLDALSRQYGVVFEQSTTSRPTRGSSCSRRWNGRNPSPSK